jgi:putative transposase
VDGATERVLQEAVEGDPREQGHPFSVWSCHDLALHLLSKGSLRVSEETIRRHLQGLDYRIVRPVLSINSPDPAYEEKAAYLEVLKEQARQGQIVLLFEDELDLNLLPGVIACWTKRGQQRKIATPGQNKKSYGFGAVDWMSGTLVYHLGERKNSDHFCALVEEIVQTCCPGEKWTGPRVVLVVDNYIIHHSKKTTACLQRYADRLTVVALPTYAPKLNVIELFWKYLRRKVTHNHLFHSVTALLEAVEEFLRSMQTRPQEVLSIIGHPV